MTRRPLAVAAALVAAAMAPATAGALPIQLPIHVPSASTPANTTPGTTTPITAPAGTTPNPSSLLVPTTPVTAASVQSDAEVQVIVRFKADLPASARTAMIAQVGATRVGELELADTELLEVSSRALAVVSLLEDQPGVRWAERNAVFSSQESGEIERTYHQLDPYWPHTWGLENFGNNNGVDDADIDAAEAWSITRGAGATVGVVDTGVDTAHADLAGQTVAGMNFLSDGKGAGQDDSGHGTHVAGTIASLHNTIGTVGAAPEAKVMPLRALDGSGSGTSASIASAFSYAGRQGLRIVNASLGASGPSKALWDSINSSPNTLFVVAAGNGGADIDTGNTALYPCQYDLANVLCVGASDNRDQPAVFSNRGRTSVDLFAPGVGIVSTVPGDGYVFQSGTSMATPHVAAIAALVASVHPDWSPTQLRERIMSSADHPAGLANVSVTGGRANAARATGLYTSTDGLAPAAVTNFRGTSPAVGSVALTWDPSPAADFTRFQLEWIENGAWTERAVLRGTSFTLNGLVPGVPRSFRVRAIDQGGDEGAPSEVLTITPLLPVQAGGAVNAAAPRATTKVVATTKSGNATASGVDATGQAVSTASVTSLKRSLSRGKLKAISFRLTAASKVTFTAEPRSTSAKKKKVRAISTVTKTLQLKAGTQTIAVGRTAKGLRLAKGSWKIVVATPSVKKSITVAVR